jgi:hypothetical protein
VCPVQASPVTFEIQIWRAAVTQAEAGRARTDRLRAFSVAGAAILAVRESVLCVFSVVVKFQSVIIAKCLKGRITSTRRSWQNRPSVTMVRIFRGKAGHNGRPSDGRSTIIDNLFFDSRGGLPPSGALSSGPGGGAAPQALARCGPNSSVVNHRITRLGIIDNRAPPHPVMHLAAAATPAGRRKVAPPGRSAGSGAAPAGFLRGGRPRLRNGRFRLLRNRPKLFALTRASPWSRGRLEKLVT